MLFAFDVASESVCAEHLKCAEKHEQVQLFTEFLGVEYAVLTAGFDVIVDKLLAESLWQSGLGLP